MSLIAGQSALFLCQGVHVELKALLRASYHIFAHIWHCNVHELYGAGVSPAIYVE